MVRQSRASPPLVSRVGDCCAVFVAGDDFPAGSTVATAIASGERAKAFGAGLEPCFDGLARAWAGRRGHQDGRSCSTQRSKTSATFRTSVDFTSSWTVA